MELFPKSYFFHCCDFSEKAIEIVKSKNKENVNAFVCDITNPNALDGILESSCDVLTMIFVLSAIPPHKQLQVVKNAHRVLKKGAFLVKKKK